MKNIATLFVLACLMITTALAVNPSENASAKNKKHAVAQRINTLIGNPSDLLQGTNQSVMISYRLDENKIMHINDISTSNTELKEYILKRLNGRKFKNAALADMHGIVKVHFVSQNQQNLYLQY